jgi:hypothetical protein
MKTFLFMHFSKGHNYFNSRGEDENTLKVEKHLISLSEHHEPQLLYDNLWGKREQFRERERNKNDIAR